MKTQIRKGIFETNSSSTHALTLDSLKNFQSAFTENEIPRNEHLIIKGGEYGWEFDILAGSLDKLIYLLTDSNKKQKKIIALAVKKHYNTTFDFKKEDGYIDHQSIGEIINHVFKDISDEDNMERVIKFLSGNSKVIITNDNSSYEHGDEIKRQVRKSYYKEDDSDLLLCEVINQNIEDIPYVAFSNEELKKAGLKNASFKDIIDAIKEGKLTK